jgi:hypothetical protein
MPSFTTNTEEKRKIKVLKGGRRNKVLSIICIKYFPPLLERTAEMSAY